MAGVISHAEAEPMNGIGALISRDSTALTSCLGSSPCVDSRREAGQQTRAVLDLLTP